MWAVAGSRTRTDKAGWLEEDEGTCISTNDVRDGIYKAIERSVDYKMSMNSVGN
jgi:hypothetical protein